MEGAERGYLKGGAKGGSRQKRRRHGDVSDEGTGQVKGKNGTKFGMGPRERTMEIS
jgi:hypothetical protein